MLKFSTPSPICFSRGETNIDLLGKLANSTPADIANTLAALKNYAGEILTLNLSCNHLSEQFTPMICGILNAHPEIQHLYLANNDFRQSGIGSISDLLRKPDHNHNIKTVDVVDNNIDRVGFLSGLLRECPHLEALYIGAKRIQGPSGEPHGVWDYKNKRYVTCYETGFNEAVSDDQQNIIAAHEQHTACFVYFCSNQRTYFHIEPHAPNNPNLKYGPEHYHGDEWCRDFFGAPSQRSVVRELFPTNAPT